MKSIIGVIILAAVVVGVYLLNGAVRRDDGKSVLHIAVPLAISVETAEPTQRDIIRTVQAPGEVEAISEVDISGEVVAKILEMPVEEGNLVKKGDLLCRLDDAVYRAMVTSAEANVAKLRAMIAQADADLDKAKRDYDRQVRLSESDATSALELADYHTSLIRARTNVDIRRQELIEMEARLQSAKQDLTKTVIVSPIDGIIAQLFAEAGEVVVTGTMNNPGTRIMVITDLSKMQVRCRVDESDAPLVKPNQSARIFLQSDTRDSIPGHVLRVATKGSKPTGRDVVTFETLVLVDSADPRVKPGMSANVEIEVARSDNALTIPVEAVLHRKRGDLPKDLLARHDEAEAKRADGRPRKTAGYVQVVFRLNGDTAQPVAVETGISDDTGVEIVSGIAGGDKIVTGPYRSLDQLKEGAKVKIESAGSGDAKSETKLAGDDDKKEQGNAEKKEQSKDDKKMEEKDKDGSESAALAGGR